MKLLPRNIKKVAILGRGLMASEIATLLVLSNYQVILKEKDEKCLLDDICRVKGAKKLTFNKISLGYFLKFLILPFHDRKFAKASQEGKGDSREA